MVLDGGVRHEQWLPFDPCLERVGQVLQERIEVAACAHYPGQSAAGPLRLLQAPHQFRRRPVLEGRGPIGGHDVDRPRLLAKRLDPCSPAVGAVEHQRPHGRCTVRRRRPRGQACHEVARIVRGMRRRIHRNGVTETLPERLDAGRSNQPGPRAIRPADAQLLHLPGHQPHRGRTGQEDPVVVGQA
jgi:hypothetical protein